MAQIKVYVSNMSGNMEIKKQQSFMLQVLQGNKVQYEEIDISLPEMEEEKQFMRAHATPKDGQKVPLPPQVFNGEAYCGDFSAFEEANEDNELSQFLKLATQDSEEQEQDTESEQDEPEPQQHFEQQQNEHDEQEEQFEQQSDVQVTEETKTEAPTPENILESQEEETEIDAIKDMPQENEEEFVQQENEEVEAEEFDKSRVVVPSSDEEDDTRPPKLQARLSNESTGKGTEEGGSRTPIHDYENVTIMQEGDSTVVRLRHDDVPKSVDLGDDGARKDEEDKEASDGETKEPES